MTISKYAVDLDGVLANFVKTFVALVNREGIAELPEDFQPAAWDFPPMTPQQLDAGFKALRSSTVFWSQLDPYVENVLAIRRAILRGKGDFYFVTSRMDTAGESALAGTKMWLSLQSLVQMNTSLVVVKSADYKPAVYAALGIYASIDDHLPTVMAAEGNGHRATLLARPWNEKYRPKGMRAVGSVEEWLGTL